MTLRSGFQWFQVGFDGVLSVFGLVFGGSDSEELVFGGPVFNGFTTRCGSSKSRTVGFFGFLFGFS